MKKTLIIATLLLIIGHAGFSQVKFGLGAVVGTKSGWEIDESAPVSADLVTNLKLNYGINARVLWEFNDKISFVGGLTYFLPTKITSDDQEINYYNMVVSANAHYNILKKDKLKLYGLGGFNFSLISTRINIRGLTEAGFGYEFGAGAQFGKLFLEGKYDGNLDQIVGTLGIYF